MKKKILTIAAIISFAATIGGNIIKNTSKEHLSDLTLSNIEALASDEGGSGKRTKCRSGHSYDPNPGHSVTECYGCIRWWNASGTGYESTC